MTDCLLYLTLPDLDADAADLLATALPSLLAGRPVAALRLETTDPARLAALLDRVLAPVQALGIAVMLTNLPEQAARRGCDGVEMDDMATSGARRSLGDDLQLGAPCGTSRDRAMQAGEDGADYVAFSGPLSELCALVEWWVEIAELPVVARVQDLSPSPEAVRKLRDAGADFIACTLPGDPDAARALLDDIGRALA